MASQYSYGDNCFAPEFEYQAEELKKKLHSSVANFAQVRFKRAVQMRMSIVDGTK